MRDDDDELGREIGGLMEELGRFSAEIRTKLKAQDDRMTRLDRKTALAARSPLEAKAAGQPHRAAFGAYLRTGTGTPQIDRINIPLHELSALPKTSQRLLDDSAFDIEGWLAGRIADTFARAEAAAFVSGNGVDKPRGILDYPRVDDDGWAWNSLGYVATGTDGGFDATNPADTVIDLVYRLGAPYRAGASFVMNSRTAGALRKLKDADGRFLWTDGLSAGEPARLLGYPVLIAEDMPDIASDACAVAFGNFEAGYTIAERPDLRVLRDPFSAKPHVIFYATKRVGGAVSDFAAIKLLKFGIA